jgi:hypothetical protein
VKPAAPATPKPNPLAEIGLTIVAPSLVLMYATERLGALPTLGLALAFPVGWAIWNGMRRGQLSWLAMIGIVSTLLTGGMGLLQLDAGWFAVKEGAVSALIGVVVAVSAWTRRPLIHALVFDAALMDTDRIAAALAARGTAEAFESRLRAGTLWLAATFFFSAAANYALARWVVSSPAGTPAFNDELGRLTLLSYPLIALPSMVMVMALFAWLAKAARQLTGLTTAELFGGGH